MARIYSTSLGIVSAEKIEGTYVITDNNGNKIGKVWKAAEGNPANCKFEYKKENTSHGGAYAGTIKEAVEAIAWSVKKYQEAAQAEAVAPVVQPTIECPADLAEIIAVAGGECVAYNDLCLEAKMLLDGVTFEITNSGNRYSVRAVNCTNYRDTLYCNCADQKTADNMEGGVDAAGCLEFIAATVAKYGDKAQAAAQATETKVSKFREKNLSKYSEVYKALASAEAAEQPAPVAQAEECSAALAVLASAEHKERREVETKDCAQRAHNAQHTEYWETPTAEEVEAQEYPEQSDAAPCERIQKNWGEEHFAQACIPVTNNKQSLALALPVWRGIVPVIDTFNTAELAPVAQPEIEKASTEAAEFVFETAANPRFVDVLLGDYIAATIQQRGHADSPACLCSAYISKDMYFSSITEAIQYIKNNAAEFAAVIRKQRAKPLRVPKAAQDVEWRTLDSFEYEGWFDNTSKGGICCFVPRWCLCIDEQGNRTTKVVRLKKDAHTGNWAAYDERTQVYSPDATGRVLLERVIAYLHNPNDVPIERALYEARESAQFYGAPQQFVGA